MKNIGRRLFAKATVGAPTAVKMASIGPTPPRGLAACGAVTAAAGLGPTEIAKATLRSKVWDALRSNVEAKRESERASVADLRRAMMGGLDPDLSVLNSMSLSRRVSIQIDRELAYRESQKTLRAKIVRMLGGDPEDFE